MFLFCIDFKSIYMKTFNNSTCLIFRLDWACGGQWNRAYQFVRLLVDAFNAAHIELIAFFDGTLKENKKMHTDRVEVRQKTISVLKHIRMIGTPPPKIWWIAPSGLRTCLRNALRSMNVIVVSLFCFFFFDNFSFVENLYTELFKLNIFSHCLHVNHFASIYKFIVSFPFIGNTIIFTLGTIFI